MKKLIRMLVFSGVSVFLTALWNKGFLIPSNHTQLAEAIVLIAFAYYLVLPIAKTILLPLNILTLGLVSIVLYALLLYLTTTYVPLIHVKDWIFPGLAFNALKIQKMTISYLENLFLASFSLSAIITLLEKLL